MVRLGMALRPPRSRSTLRLAVGLATVLLWLATAAALAVVAYALFVWVR